MSLVWLVLALLVGFVIGRLVLLHRPRKHEHLWVVTGAHKINAFTHDEAKYPRRHTYVLEVCGCAATRSREIDGHWEMSQLTPAALYGSTT